MFSSDHALALLYQSHVSWEYECSIVSETVGRQDRKCCYAILPTYLQGTMMLTNTVNPTSEHELYLKLFITNGGGW